MRASDLKYNTDMLYVSQYIGKVVKRGNYSGYYLTEVQCEDIYGKVKVTFNKRFVREGGVTKEYYGLQEFKGYLDELF